MLTENEKNLIVFALGTAAAALRERESVPMSEGDAVAECQRLAMKVAALPDSADLLRQLEALPRQRCGTDKTGYARMFADEQGQHLSRSVVLGAVAKWAGIHTLPADPEPCLLDGVGPKAGIGTEPTPPWQHFPTDDQIRACEHWIRRSKHDGKMTAVIYKLLENSQNAARLHSIQPGGVYPVLSSRVSGDCWLSLPAGWHAFPADDEIESCGRWLRKRRENGAVLLVEFLFIGDDLCDNTGDGPPLTLKGPAGVGASFKHYLADEWAKCPEGI